MYKSLDDLSICELEELLREKKARNNKSRLTSSMKSNMRSGRSKRERINGIKNIGYTCFMNSALQMFQVPFVNMMRKIPKLNDDELLSTLLEVYKGGDKIEEFHGLCSKAKEWRSMDLDKKRMNDSVRFLLQLIIYMKGIDSNMIVPLLYVQPSEVKKCSNDNSHRNMLKIKPRPYLIALEDSSISQMVSKFLENISYCKNSDCKTEMNRVVNMPKYLLIKNGSPNSLKLQIDTKFRIQDWPHEYHLTGVTVTTGSHATSYATRNGVSFTFQILKKKIINSK